MLVVHAGGNPRWVGNRVPTHGSSRWLMATGHQAQASLEVQVDAASPFMSEPLLDSVTHTTVIGLGRCKKREGVSVQGLRWGAAILGSATWINRRLWVFMHLQMKD